MPVIPCQLDNTKQPATSPPAPAIAPLRDSHSTGPRPCIPSTRDMHLLRTSATQTTIPQPPPSVSCSTNATYHSLPSAMTTAPMTHHLERHLRLTTYSESPSDDPATTTASIKRRVSRQPMSSSSSPVSSSRRTSWHYTIATHSCRTSSAHAYTCNTTTSSGSPNTM